MQQFLAALAIVNTAILLVLLIVLWQIRGMLARKAKSEEKPKVRSDFV